MLKRILSIYGNHKREVASMFGLILILQGMSLIGPYFFGRMMDSIISKENMWFSIELASVSLVFALLSALLSYIQWRVDVEHLWFPMQEYLRMKTIDQYLSLSIGFFKTHHSGLTKEILSNGEQAMQRLGRKMIKDFVPTTMKFLVTAGVLLWFYPSLGLIIMVGLAIYALCQWVMEKKYTPLIDERQEKSRVANKYRGELISGASLIKTYSKEEDMREDYRIRYRNSMETSIRNNRYITKWDKTISCILDITQTIAMIAGIIMIFRGKLTLGQLTAATMWWKQTCTAISSIGDQYQETLTEISDAKKFFQLIDTESPVKEIDDPISLKKVVGFIEFKHVSFGYPRKDGFGSGKSIIRNVSLTIRAGEKVAIVGPSGSGKTSLITLLFRGYDPDAGSIEVDGNNLRTLRMKSLYDHMALVDQGSLMIDDTIRKNIQLGSHTELSDADMLAICSLVELDMSSFKNGLDTTVGEMGSEISGGERQRIAIARALARNPKILVLDEATASLDAIKEARIKRAIDLAARGRTTIVIAHRLATVQNADRISLMKEGEIVATGTHHELLRKSGLYLELVQEQMIKC